MKRRRKPKPKAATIRRKKRSRAPRTLQAFNAMSDRDQDAYIDSMNIVSDVIANKGSLYKVARDYNRDPRTVLTWASESLRKLPNGRYVPNLRAHQLRVLVLPDIHGNQEVAVLDHSQASQIGKYWVAVDRALGPNEDVTPLNTFEGEYIIDANGNRVPFLTDLAELKHQYSAGNLSFETIYARRA